MFKKLQLLFDNFFFKLVEKQIDLEILRTTVFDLKINKCEIKSASFLK